MNSFLQLPPVVELKLPLPCTKLVHEGRVHKVDLASFWQLVGLAVLKEKGLTPEHEHQQRLIAEKIMDLTQQDPSQRVALDSRLSFPYMGGSTRIVCMLLHQHAACFFCDGHSEPL